MIFLFRILFSKLSFYFSFLINFWRYLFSWSRQRSFHKWLNASSLHFGENGRGGQVVYIYILYWSVFVVHTGKIQIDFPYWCWDRWNNLLQKVSVQVLHSWYIVTVIFLNTMSILTLFVSTMSILTHTYKIFNISR